MNVTKILVLLWLMGSVAFIHAKPGKRDKPGKPAPIDTDDAPIDTDDAPIDTDDAPIDNDDAPIDNDDAPIDIFDGDDDDESEGFIKTEGKFVPGRPVLDDDGNPIGLEECGSYGYDVDGYPCSNFILTPFQEVFTSTESFNPPKKEALGEVCRDDGHCANVYDFDVFGIQVELFKHVLTGCDGKPTKLISYGGTVPAAMIENLVGKETYVQFNNKIQQEDTPRDIMWNFEGCDPQVDEGKQGVPIVVHNHGQAAISAFDGFAIDQICFGETKSYMYPNNRPTTGWYHDHALHLTAYNVLYGLAGLYYITEKTSSGGCGDPFNMDDMEEIFMQISDAGVNGQCQINFDFDGPHGDNYYADINMVNGHPFPTLANMGRKWYRFRALNGSSSRPYLLRIVTPDGIDVSSTICTTIASDGGYFYFGPQPFPEEGLIIGVAERYEFVCDFGKLDESVSTLILYNDYDDERMKAVPYFTYSNFLMKFEFNDGFAEGPVFDPNDRGNIDKQAPGSVLKDAIGPAFAMAEQGEAHRTFKFDRGGGLWTINGETWDTKRVAASDVGQNSWEVWEIETGGGWFHPVHVHLVDFFILKREDVGGVGAPDTYGLAGAPKDEIYLGPGETAYMLARFGPHRGEFMIHCHNTIHEDHDMLRSFIISRNTNSKKPKGRGTTEPEYLEINGILYGDYEFANPLVGSLLPTTNPPPIFQRAQELLDANFYQIFYPLPDDPSILQNNAWKVEQCFF